MRSVLITALVMLGLCAAYYGLLGRRHMREMADLQQKIASAYDGATASESQMSRVEPLRRTAEHLEESCRSLSAHLVGDAVATPPLLQVSALLESAGLTIVRSEVLPDAPRTGLASAKLHVAVTGTFANLFRALATIENARPPMRTVSLGVQAASIRGKVEADMVLVRVWNNER